MGNLTSRIDLTVASRDWLNREATVHHYMHRPVHARACPFGWSVTLDGQQDAPDGRPYGFIVYASIHFTRLKDVFGYPDLPTKWQVLSLARLWLHDEMPKMSATCVIGKSLKLVQRRWLEVHPPRFPNEPYHILKVISYADREYHKGTIYKAANFKLDGDTTSKPRHKNTRGPGMDGHTLSRYIYTLPEPDWTYEFAPSIPSLQQMALEM